MYKLNHFLLFASYEAHLEKAGLFQLNSYSIVNADNCVRKAERRVQKITKYEPISNYSHAKIS